MRNKTLRAKNVSFIFSVYICVYLYVVNCCFFSFSFVSSRSLLFSINDFPFSIASRHDQFIFGALALYQPTYVYIYFRLKPSQLKTERLAKHFEYICYTNCTMNTIYVFWIFWIFSMCVCGLWFKLYVKHWAIWISMFKPLVIRIAKIGKYREKKPTSQGEKNKKDENHPISKDFSY